MWSVVAALLAGSAPVAAPSTSSGRLERQTARGTVAIRELVAGRCEEVTEALALSLELGAAGVAHGSTGASHGSAAGWNRTSPLQISSVRRLRLDSRYS